ncbi:MAG: GNAT family N-acetyltransferase [Thiohalocapsa sp.]
MSTKVRHRQLFQRERVLTIGLDDGQDCHSLNFLGQEIASAGVSWDQLLHCEEMSETDATYQLRVDGHIIAVVDAIDIQGLSLGGIDALDLFLFAWRLMSSNGLLICSIASTRADDEAPAEAPESVLQDQLTSFCSIAQRCGLKLVEQEIDSLGGAGCRAVVAFVKGGTAPRWGLDHLRESEVGGFLRLFRDSFGAEYDAALWRWKFAAERGRAVVAKRDGRLVAHYGSTKRTISFFGRTGSALQICDVMVDPNERGVMTKKGAMFITTATFLELYLGLERHTVAYGFPNRRHMVLGAKLGLYAEVARMMEVRWPVSSSARRHALHTTPLDLEQEAKSIDRSWNAMRASLQDAVCVIRDRDYIRYRYSQHPLKRYEVLCVRSGLLKSLKGVIVLRKDQADCELLDIVAPLKNISLLISAAKLTASSWGCSSLYCWITESFAQRFVQADGTMNDLGIVVPTSVWVPRPEPQKMAGKWWLMSGDTEFR